MRDQFTTRGGGGTTRTTASKSDKTKTAPSSSVIKKITTRKSRRKTRKKTRKKPTKYLSLGRLQLSSDENALERYSTDNMPTHEEDKDGQQQQEENMAFWFSASDGGATTLTGLLGAATTPSSAGEDSRNRSSTCTTNSSGTTTWSPQAEEDSEEVAQLVRTAMRRRNKERDRCEERWVRYSEVVERREDQEVSSGGGNLLGWCARKGSGGGGLWLKLDYEKILNAWSDKAPLYVHAPPPESPQTVPDVLDHYHFFPSQLSNHDSSGVWGSHGDDVWRVPEMMVMRNNTNYDQQGVALTCRVVKREEEEEDADDQVVAVGKELKVVLGQREASVRRYKEKRQNRLFSKRIRYEVRKLNADKRPRLKGRFVKTI